MRRGKVKNVSQYIDVRIEQLKEDMDKASDPYDKQWYNRIISELYWAKSPNHNCYIEQEAWFNTSYKLRR